MYDNFIERSNDVSYNLKTKCVCNNLLSACISLKPLSEMICLKTQLCFALKKLKKLEYIIPLDTLTLTFEHLGTLHLSQTNFPAYPAIVIPLMSL